MVTAIDTIFFPERKKALTSKVRSTVKRSDFEATGDTMRFEMLTRQSTLEGNVKMIVRGKARTPSEKPE